MIERLELECGDVLNLLNRYIIQINEGTSQPHKVFENERLDFLLEKRVSRISKVAITKGHKDLYFLSGLCYSRTKGLTEHELMERINKRGDRYYRLLTLEETLMVERTIFEKSTKSFSFKRIKGEV